MNEKQKKQRVKQTRKNGNIYIFYDKHLEWRSIYNK